ncbi:MAG: indole-3-glycerol phosphate synthase, partial [Firmicutes bacterium]|nr:indole-3-glycerol phosphate synthase [Bacillota bacterium]
AKIIGINNRDLDTFDTRLEFSQEMAELMPPNVVKISESGIGRTADVTWLGDIGFAAVLVGESLMRGASILEALPRGRNR